jgi:peptidoglycan/xylan/chitin deacetylase (PgdA/CDA1 family)
MAGERLSLGPAWVQAIKPLVTRAQTEAWRRSGQRSLPGLRILFYHRVSDDPDPLAIAPGRFAAQMELLRAEGYRVVDVVTAADALARGDRLDGTVALSFDDGYRDIAEHALPQLERFGFAASVFLATAVTGGETTFSWYEHQPPVLGWSEVERLDSGSPLRFEAHTVTHPNLTALDDATARSEIADSKVELEARLGRPVRGFCYPAGLYGARERALVAEAGFAAATTCEPGANLPGSDPLVLRRTAVDRADRLIDFRAKLAGAHDRPSPLRAAYRRVRFSAARR